MAKAKLVEHRQVVDTETGEIVEYNQKTVTPVAYFCSEPFGTYYRTAFQQLADMVLSTTARRLIICLMAEVQEQNLIPTTVALMSKRFGMNRTSIHRALQELRSANFLLTAPEMSKCTYMLNPRVAWFSRASNRPQEMYNYPELRQP